MKKHYLIFGAALTLSSIILLAQNQSGARRNSGVGGPGQRMVFPIVAALDVNSDNVIDVDEIAKASESLKKLDKNSDGKLTMDEIMPQRPGGPGGAGGPPPPPQQ